jgi:polyribonucleotide nucleotidyltransferase
MAPITISFQYGDQTVTLETARVAKQASGSVIATVGDTVVMANVVGNRNAPDNPYFFPLTVDYQERTYAAGKIPGGFFKREGRPSEKETLTCRLIDRPIRPLFPKGFRKDVQIVCTVMSLDPSVDPDIVALIASSAAMSISGLPFKGPIGAARVGYIDGQYVLNPSFAGLDNSQLNLVVAGTANSVLMVESEAQQLSEEVMLGAVMFGHEQLQTVIAAISDLVIKTGVDAWDWEAAAPVEGLAQAVATESEQAITQAYGIVDKLQRRDALSAAKSSATETLLANEGAAWTAADVGSAIDKLEHDIVRGSVVAGNPRIDGRGASDIRDISVEVGVLPRTHGSALFTRGETQAVVVTTLGTARDSQIIDAIEGERRDPFMLHYNFPPYCVGETGRVGSPKRREIGHGRLAKRGMQAVMPDMDEFPYVLRVVSEITESNGSSSMASVCGTSLSLMDAGVPIAAPVAGIAMGLIKQGEEFVVLSDIMGDEDHLGDMDFKVAGTAAGITALQMDIKIDGITKEIMDAALTQAQSGRMHILGEMNKVISSHREEMSEHAPRIISIKIDPDKIRDVIGKGGATIRQITEETGTTIDITDDGMVKIASVDSAAGNEALRRVEAITADVEVGAIYEGKVQKLMDFGAFVNILPGKDGLVHISQISDERVENVSDKLSEGDTVKVKVLEIDKQGRVRLSMKAVGADE